MPTAHFSRIAPSGLEETLVCTAPPHKKAETVDVTVRIAGTDMRAKSLSFAYYGA